MFIIQPRSKSRLALSPRRTRNLQESALYEKKISELRGLISEEAKRLQDVKELETSAKAEVERLHQSKSKLTETIEDLGVEIMKAEEQLSDLKERKLKLVEHYKQELNQEKQSLAQVKKKVDDLQSKIDKFQGVTQELQRFISKESQARQRYLQEQERLAVAQKEYRSVTDSTRKGLQILEQEKKEIDKSKKSIADMSGKLSVYASEVRLATIYLNKKLAEGKLPVRYEVPPKKIKIPFI